MYLEHFGFSEAPFKITPHTEFFFAGANRGETLDALIYTITSGEGMVKVTGEVGAGKTMLCRVLMERLPKTVETIYLAVPSLSRDELLAVIAGDLGIDTQGGNTTKLVRALQERLIGIHADGKQVVALIDEAHAMPLETLEQIRLLSNLETSHDKLMQIVLFGQPELDQHLSLPNMRQLKERITHSFNLLPLPARDIKDYLNFRVRAAGYKGPDLFSTGSIKLIAEASEGLTRRINIYADKTLLAAFASGTHTVTEDHVRAAISDTQILPPQTGNRIWLMWVASCLALAVGLGLGFVAGLHAGKPTPPVVANAEPVIKPIASTIAQPSNATVNTPTTASGLLPDAIPTGPAIAAKLPIIETSKLQPTANQPIIKSTPSVAMQSSQPANNKSAIIANKIPVPTLALNVAAPVNTGGATQPASMTEKDWLDKRMQADLKRISSLKASQYAIQLMTADAREKPAIENYLRVVSKELNPDRIMVYPTGTNENPRVSVLYGNYDERADANGELLGLPPKLQRFNPYARSFKAIRDDIRPGQ